MSSRVPGETEKWPVWNPQTVNSSLLFWRWRGYGSSHMHTLTPQGDAPNAPWQGSEEPEKMSNTQLKSSPSWILPSEVLCRWAWGGVWKPVFRRSFPSGFNDQPSLGMVGLIFIVFSFFLPEVTWVQKQNKWTMLRGKNWERQKSRDRKV